MKERALAAGFLFLGLFCLPCSAGPEAGWGINGRLSTLPEADLKARLDLLQAADVNWLREDYRSNEPNHSLQAGNLGQARERGFKFLALIPYQIDKAPLYPGDQLYEDLRDVYQAAKKWSHDSKGYVDAWEMFNEADVGFCRDLPDRSSAYMKAVYLGLKAGRQDEDVPVMMGALALPPGPWLERAARNGLLDYADAFNFHYYGDLEDLADLVKMDRGFLSSQACLRSERFSSIGSLPLWITECGYSAGPDLRQKERQAAYLSATARTARFSGVASFFPYALTASKGFALWGEGNLPSPAWNDFSAFASKHGLSRNPPFVRSLNAGPIVLQWLPKQGQAIPHKPSGTYRFFPGDNGKGWRAIDGELRIYNFGDENAEGRIRIKGLKSVQAGIQAGPFTYIPAGGMVSIPVRFTPAASGYFREWCTVDFKREKDDWKKPGKPRDSSVFFGLEAIPLERDFQEAGINYRQVSSTESFKYIDSDLAPAISSKAGPWLGLNGLLIEAGKDGLLGLKLEKAATKNGPPMAVAKVKGLPGGSFLRLKANRILGRDLSFRVDLIDQRGQRFTIFENSGMSPFGRTNEVWLNLEDFHLYFWGRCLNPNFDPASVREIQIRPYLEGQNAGVSLGLDLMVPHASLNP